MRYREVTGEVQLKLNLMRERISYFCLLLGIVLFWLGMVSFLYYIPRFSFTSLGETSELTLLIIAGSMERSLHLEILEDEKLICPIIIIHFASLP